MTSNYSHTVLRHLVWLWWTRIQQRSIIHIHWKLRVLYNFYICITVHDIRLTNDDEKNVGT